MRQNKALSLALAFIFAGIPRAVYAGGDWAGVSLSDLDPAAAPAVAAPKAERVQAAENAPEAEQPARQAFSYGGNVLSYGELVVSRMHPVFTSELFEASWYEQQGAGWSGRMAPALATDMTCKLHFTEQMSWAEAAEYCRTSCPKLQRQIHPKAVERLESSGQISFDNKAWLQERKASMGSWRVFALRKEVVFPSQTALYVKKDGLHSWLMQASLRLSGDSFAPILEGSSFSAERGCVSSAYYNETQGLVSEEVPLQVWIDSREPSPPDPGRMAERVNDFIASTMEPISRERRKVNQALTVAKYCDLIPLHNPAIKGILFMGKAYLQGRSDALTYGQVRGETTAKTMVSELMLLYGARIPMYVKYAWKGINLKSSDPPFLACFQDGEQRICLAAPRVSLVDDYINAKHFAHPDDNGADRGGDSYGGPARYPTMTR